MSLLARLKNRWNKFWESEARKLDSALFNMVAEKTREENKDFIDWYEGKTNTTEYWTKHRWL